MLFKKKTTNQNIITDEKKIDELLHRGVVQTSDIKALKDDLMSSRQMRIKLGIDPTSPFIHLGRTVPLLKLRDFQELGHQVVFIVGDFTAVIGDTSDKDAERPMLSVEKIKENVQNYAEQAMKILDPELTEVHYNSEWLSKLGFHEIGEIADLLVRATGR